MTICRETTAGAFRTYGFEVAILIPTAGGYLSVHHTEQDEADKNQATEGISQTELEQTISLVLREFYNLDILAQNNSFAQAEQQANLSSPSKREKLLLLR